jgi:simple sugar transport system ATP-binding protein
MSTVEEHVPDPAGRDADGHALLEMQRLSKYFGNVIALQNITTSVRAGEVTCVLGDNGAGKSTLIKILAGVHRHDDGQFLMDGKPMSFHSPREAKAAGIATVYQDLAMAPLMSIWRNFWLGSEPTTWLGTIDTKAAKSIAVEELAKMGIEVRDPEQPVGTLSGGERQSVAIARAVYFGAKVLILDEPTAALGVKQSGVVLRYTVAARDRGLGVIFITHNPHHAYPVGDRFLILKRGQSLGNFAKREITRDELVQLMSGGAELEALSHEIESLVRPK